MADVTHRDLGKLLQANACDRPTREIEGHRPTSNPWWQAKVRQQLQRLAVRVGAGEWALQEGIAA